VFRPKRIPLVVLAVAGLAVAAVAWQEIAEEAEPHPAAAVAIDGLLPGFDPGRARYVSRCGRGAPAMRVAADGGARIAVGSDPPAGGERAIDPGAGPGEDFPLAIVRDGERRTYRVRCLPADFPNWRFEPIRPIAPGLFAVSFRAFRDQRPWVVVFDHEGVPRWWYSPSTRALWAQVLSDGSIAWARRLRTGPAHGS